MLEKTNQLSTEQLKDLEQLTDICKKSDGSAPNLYTYLLTQHRSLPASFLYYKKHQLVGFLSVYFFYEDAVEVSLLVDPAFRRQGIAKQLIEDGLPLIAAQNINKMVFSSPSQLNDKWLTALGFSMMHSEYYMERDNLNPLLDYKQSLTFRPAKEEDIPALCALDEVCFPKKHTDLTHRFHHLINDRNYEIVIAFQNDNPIGKAHVRWESHGGSLSDIAISPVLQGKGFGSALIAHCINKALGEGKPHLSLDVETHNKRALNLYTRLGFLVKNACDYWTINVDQLFVKNEQE